MEDNSENCSCEKLVRIAWFVSNFAGQLPVIAGTELWYCIRKLSNRRSSPSLQALTDYASLLTYVQSFYLCRLIEGVVQISTHGGNSKYFCLLSSEIIPVIRDHSIWYYLAVTTMNTF